ncbi:Scr1 family TA system antitoxin-like transcriptional regulator [Streptomyces sp. NPDC048282]|uniref:Scr1 family TA system antitoxin-like transcriptional regulator n=1 Tax=Streptomyces sp. NPDC048282 TaxID=3365528 RepID=UPI00371FE521
MAELEHHAAALRALQTAHIPGLFQTEGHARALFDLFVPALPRLEVELRIAHRLARHTVIANSPWIPSSSTHRDTPCPRTDR